MKQSSLYNVFFALVAICSFFFLHCGVEPSSEGQEQSTLDASAPFETSLGESGTELFLQKEQRAAYALRWNWEGARWDDTQQTYQFQNNLGYTIGIKAGYVSTTAVQLVPCQVDEAIDESAEQRLGLAPLFRLPLSFGMRVARADHAYENDTSLHTNALVELIHNRQEVLFGKGVASGKIYCKLHILHAPLSRTASDNTTLKHKSALLKGWYKAPTSQEKVEFQASTFLSAGALRSLKTAQRLRENTYQSDATVEIVRFPVPAFQDLELKQLSHLELAYTFLQRLGGHTHVHVTLH